MNKKRSFKVFIYISVLLHLAGGALYYYKKHASSFEFFKAKEPLVSEEGEVEVFEDSSPVTVKERLKNSPPTKVKSKPSFKSFKSASDSKQKMDFCRNGKPFNRSTERETLSAR